MNANPNSLLDTWKVNDSVFLFIAGSPPKQRFQATPQPR